MKLTTNIVALSCLVASAFVDANPVPSHHHNRDPEASWSSGLSNGKCINPIVRKEW